MAFNQAQTVDAGHSHFNDVQGNQIVFITNNFISEQGGGRCEPCFVVSPAFSADPIPLVAVEDAASRALLAFRGNSSATAPNIPKLLENAVRSTRLANEMDAITITEADDDEIDEPELEPRTSSS